ncbi:DUF6612 family protein [Evansella clarkii]|uniref:DUF6612 family protein n=1 Tax=Evansella clarkii TaxID=79879 RepID=UPI000B434A0D|nr:DUF6612 family protein [Evansella clarkii]
MKKSLSLILACGLLTLMSACGESEATGEGDISLEEILSNSASAAEEIESYSFVTEVQQTMGMDEESMSFDMSTEADVLVEPSVFYQKTTMDMGELGGEMSYESYFSEEHGLFMEDPLTSEWMKYPENLMEDILSMSEAQMSPSEQLIAFQDNISELSLEEDENYFILNLAGDGEEMKEIVEQIGNIAGDGMDEIFTQMMSELEIHELVYEIFIDKETFHPAEATVFINMTIEMLGQSMTLEQNADMSFSSFNELEEFEVPQEIIENAEELSEEDAMGNF